MDTTFGDQLRMLREARNMSQTDLAKASDLTQSYISKVERGEFGAPSVRTIEKIASALETNPDALLAAAGRSAQDLSRMIAANPENMAPAIRDLGSLDQDVQAVVTGMVKYFVALLNCARPDQHNPQAERKALSLAKAEFKKGSEACLDDKTRRLFEQTAAVMAAKLLRRS